jgi:hypothetical protein
MKKLLLLLAVITLFSCEKDDICSGTTPTTPRIVLSFYSAETGLPRPVENLRVTGTGAEESIVFNESLADDQRYLANDTIVRLPLRTLEGRTEYQMVYDFGDPLSRTEMIQFNYETKDIYVSRACGFKTLFTLNAGGGSAPPVTYSPGFPSGWIRSAEIIKNNIESEDETHIRIFF